MGKTTKALLFTGLFLVLLVGIRVMMQIANPPNDKQLIATALAESIKQSKEGRPGGVLDLLAANLKVNGESVGGNNAQVMKYIRENKPDVTVENMDPVVTGDEATLVSPVNISISFLGHSVDKQLKDVHMVFQKLDDKEWLVIPTHRWKLTEVQVQDTSMADLMPG